MPVHTNSEDRGGHWCLSLLLYVSFLTQGLSLKQKLTVLASLTACKLLGSASCPCPQILVLLLQAHAAIPFKKCGCWVLELRTSCLQSKNSYPKRYLLSFCLTLFNIEMLIYFLKYKKWVEGEKGKGWPDGTKTKETRDRHGILLCSEVTVDSGNVYIFQSTIIKEFYFFPTKCWMFETERFILIWILHENVQPFKEKSGKWGPETMIKYIRKSGFPLGIQYLSLGILKSKNSNQKSLWKAGNGQRSSQQPSLFAHACLLNDPVYCNDIKWPKIHNSCCTFLRD